MDEKLQQNIMRFKMELLGKLPFYGDILMHVVMTEDKTVKTSCTNGRIILYNPAFLRELSVGEQNYVLMHEIMHILMLHCARGKGKEPGLFNAAADILANAELARLESSLHRAGIAFKAPVDRISAEVGPSETVENLYEMLKKDNQEELPEEPEKEKENRRPRAEGRGLKDFLKKLE